MEKVMTQDEAFDVIASERAYQDAMVAREDRPDMIPALSVAETILAMEHALAEARREWYSGSKPHKGAMGFLRKVAGLAVQAAENHGMPRREGF